MKKLPLYNREHIRLELAFKEWLAVIGYSAASVYGMPNQLREFFHFLESRNTDFKTVTPELIKTYFTYLSTRKKERRSGVMSVNYLYKYIQALRLFSLYLKETRQGGFDVDIILPRQMQKPALVLSREEMRALYEACDGTAFGMRDRAMLSVYYGCGLRRSEGENLNVKDFHRGKEVLHIRRAKNNKERLVPITATIKEDLINYLQYGRPALEKDPSEPAFFLNHYGHRISGQSLILRLKKLLKKAEIDKNAGLHTLRHSIATHLLQTGVPLSSIGQFLGHTTLDSTQIYTHIIEELNQ